MQSRGSHGRLACRELTRWHLCYARTPRKRTETENAAVPFPKHATLINVFANSISYDGLQA